MIGAAYPGQLAPGQYPATVVTGPPSASINATQDDNTTAIAGTVSVSASVTATQADNTAAIVEQVKVIASVSATQADNTAAISSTVQVNASISATQADNTAAVAVNVVNNSVTVSVDATQDNNTAAVSSSVSVTVSLAVTQDDNTAQVAASVAVPVSADINATQDDNSAVITATSDAVSQVAGGYDDDKPKKPRKKFFIEQDGKLLVFGTQSAALKALEAIKPVSAKVEGKKVRVPTPQVVVDLPAVQEYAQVIGQVEQYNSAYNSQQFAQILALFEQMQDEEEIEMLLLSL